MRKGFTNQAYVVWRGLEGEEAQLRADRCQAYADRTWGFGRIDVWAQGTLFDGAEVLSDVPLSPATWEAVARGVA